MTKLLAPLALALLASVASAADKPAPAAPVDPPDQIVPLNVRDPAALVMGPGPYGPGPKPTYAVEPPAKAPAEPAPDRAAKAEADKNGPRAGRRAVGVPIDEDQLLTVKVGDRVDLIAVFDATTTAGGKRKVAATMLQNVRVLGVTKTEALHAKGVVTLELNPVEAQYALLGVRQGELGLSVRGPGDLDIYPMEMSSFAKFFQ